MTSLKKPMKMGFLLSVLLILSVITLNTWGAHSAQALGRSKPSIGNFNGTLLVDSIPGLKNRLQEEIRAEVKDEGGDLTIDIQNPTGGTSLLKSIRATQWKNFGYIKPVTFELSIPDLQRERFTMREIKKAGKSCYISDSKYEVDFCLDDENLTLDIVDHGRTKLSIYLTRFDIQPPLKNEESREFTVSQAIDIALERNFEIQLERENMFKTRLLSKRAKLSLLPHLGFNSVANTGVGIATADPISVLSVVSEFVPFLFPSNIIDAITMEWQAKAEQMVYTLLRANTAVSIQQLCVDYVNKRNLHSEIQKVSDQTADVLSVIQVLEKSRKMKPGSADRMQVNLDRLQEALLVSSRQLNETSGTIAGTLGFNNPGAIKNIILDDNITQIEAIPLLSEEDLDTEAEQYAQYAIQNSLEIKQQTYLNYAARDNEVRLFLNWLTPNGNTPLGFNLIAEDQLAKSAKQVIADTVNKLRQRLKGHTYGVFEDRNNWRRFYHTAESTFKLRQKMWDDYIHPFLAIKAATQPLDGNEVSTGPEAGKPTRLVKLKVAPARDLIIDLLAGQRSYHSARAIVTMSQAEIDRLALRGPYKRLLPHVHDENEDTITAPMAVVP